MEELTDVKGSYELQYRIELIKKEFELRAKGYCYREIRNINITSGLVTKSGTKNYCYSGIEQRHYRYYTF